MKSANWMGSILSPPTASSPSPWVRLGDLLLDWLDRSRQRSALARLDDRMLSDIGCTRADAQAEASKSFWEN